MPYCTVFAPEASLGRRRQRLCHTLGTAGRHGEGKDVVDGRLLGTVHPTRSGWYGGGARNRCACGLIWERKIWYKQPVWSDTLDKAATKSRAPRSSCLVEKGMRRVRAIEAQLVVHGGHPVRM